MIRHRAVRWLVLAASGLTLIGCQQGSDNLSVPASPDVVAAVITDGPVPKFLTAGAGSGSSTTTSTTTTTPPPDPVPAELVTPWQPATTTTTTTTTTAPAPPPPPAQAPERRVRIASAPAPAPAPAAAPAPPAPAVNTEGAGTLVALTNDVRAGVGLAPLQRDGSLDAMAADWARELARSGRLRHSNIPSSIVGKPWSTVGENVGYGPSVARVHDALVNSPGHYANITGANYTRLGVGVAVDGGGQVWVVEVFAG
ncbi:MAG TPA: CAP domain-containing protein [Acidimicrobiales bacterium]